MVITVRKAMRKCWVSFFRIMLIFLVLLMLFLGWLLGSEGGRIALVKQGVSLIETFTLYEVDLVDVRAPSLSQWHISKVHVRDKLQDHKITVNKIDLHWHWLSAVQNRWWIRSLTIDSLNVVLAPSQSGVDSTDTASVSLLSNNPVESFIAVWDALPSIQVEHFELKQSHIERPLYPPLAFSVVMQAALHWGALPASVTLVVVPPASSDAVDSNRFAFTVKASSIEQVHIKGNLHAAVGSDWAEWLHWEQNKPVDATWDALIDYGLGDIEIAMNQLILPWGPHQLQINGAATVQLAPLTFNLKGVDLLLDDNKASLQGTLGESYSDVIINVDQWALQPIANILSIESLSGYMNLEGVVQGGWQQPLFNGHFDAQGQWQNYPFSISSQAQTQGSDIQLASLYLTLANNQWSVEGELNRQTQQLDFDISASMQTDPTFLKWIDPILPKLQGSLALEGRLSGTVAKPSLGLDISGQGEWDASPFELNANAEFKHPVLSVNQLVVRSDFLETQGQGQYQLSDQTWQFKAQVDRLSSQVINKLGLSFPVDHAALAEGALTLQGTASTFTLSSDAQVSGQWQNQPVNGQISIESLTASQITLGASDITLGNAQLMAQGQVDWSNQALDLSLNHQQWPINTITVWFANLPSMFDSLKGTLTGQTLLKGPWNQPAITSDSQLTGAWLQQALSAQILIEPKTNEHWDIQTFTLRWLDSDWSYQGDFFPYQLNLGGQVDVTQLHAKWLPTLTGLTGNPQQLPPGFDLTLDVAVAMNGSVLAPIMKGSAKIAGILEQDQFSTEMDIAYLDSQRIEITKASGSWAQGEWEVSGAYNWANQQVALQVDTDSSDVHYLIPWLQLGLQNQQQWSWVNDWQGSLKGTINLDNRQQQWNIRGNLMSRGRLLGDDYELNWDGNDSNTHVLTAQWGISEFSGELSQNQESLNANMTFKWLNLERLAYWYPQAPDGLMGLVSGDVSIEGPLDQLNYQARLEAGGQFPLMNSLHRFDATLGFSGRPDNWFIDRSVVRIADGLELSVEGSGTATDIQLNLNGVIPSSRYWIDNEEFGEGVAGFWLTASGNVNAPDMKGKFNWKSSTLPLKLALDLTTLQQQYQLDSTLYDDNDNPKVSLSMQLPQRPFSQWQRDWKAQSINLELSLDTDLDTFDPFFVNVPDIQLNGNLTGALSLTGTLLQPRWGGGLQWNQGRLEDVRYGATIDDINLELLAQDQQWRLSATGTDGDQGRVRAIGRIIFSDDEYTILSNEQDVSLHLEQANLLNQPQMQATVNGNLNVRGSYHDSVMSGDLDITNLDMQTDTFLNVESQRLTIITDEDDASTTPRELPAYWPQGQWNIRLTADQRVKLNGQGLDAELSGSVQLQDNLYNPVLSGTFSVIRGTYSGLGQTFLLDRGDIRIQNNQLVLDIQGRNTLKVRLEEGLETIEVTIRITGTQDALSLALTSNSDLEQDELLAQILFGKIVDDLDVLQAIQLANVVNQLRTGNSGFDFIGATRDGVGLDSLVVDTDTDEQGNLGLSISAGKYLNDYLYLEVTQQVGNERDFRGSLQLQVTPSTNLELYTQGEQGILDESGIELNWSRDY